MPPDEISLEPFLEGLWARRITILVATGLGIVATLLIVFLQKPVYRSIAIVVTPSGTGSVSIGQALAGATSPLGVLNGIGRSPRVTRAVSEATGLSGREVQTALDFEESPVFSQLVISAEWPSRKMSLAMVETALSEMRGITANLSLTLGENEAKQLTVALAARETELNKAQAKLAQMTAKFKTVPDEASPLKSLNTLNRLRAVEFELGKVTRELEVRREQARKVSQADILIPVAIPGLDEWRARVVELEYDLRVALTKFGDDAPEVETVRREAKVARDGLAAEVRRYISAVDGNLADEFAKLEATRQTLEWQRGVLAELAKSAPAEAVAFAKQRREVEALDAAARLIRNRLEEANVAAEVYKFPWTVLQPPMTQATPINKSYSIAAAISGVSGLLLSIFGVCLSIAYREKRRASA